MRMSHLKPGAYQVKDASTVYVTTIMRHFAKHKMRDAYRAQLQQQCHSILLNSEVKPNSTLELVDSKLARAYGITNLLILNCEGSSDQSYLKECSKKLRVSHKTKVSVVAMQSLDFYNLKSGVNQVPLGGLEKELEQLKTLLKFSKALGSPFLRRNTGVILHGPPGCGKSSLSRAVAVACQAAFLCAKASDILKPEIGSGAQAMSDTFSRILCIAEEGPVVLFIDELEMLCPNPKVTDSLGTRQVTSALVAEMDKLHHSNVFNILIIAATNTISCVNPTLRRPGRFDREILLNIPSKQQRLAILQVLTSSMNVAYDVSLSQLAKMAIGYSGADLQALCQDALNQAISRLASISRESNTTCVCMDDFKNALLRVSPSLKKGLGCHVELQPVSWNDIGGLEDVKAEIKQSVEWPLLHPTALRRMDLKASGGLLLYGPPGCCKTTLVRAAATSCNVTFLSLTSAQVYSPYVGESERIISEAFQKARALAPALLFFDEIDSIVGKRSSSGTGGHSRVQERILATMLNEMDGIGTRLDAKVTALGDQGQTKEKMCDTVTTVDGCASESERNKCSQSQPEIKPGESNIDLSRVIVVGATNRPDMLDPAILRPGRLDKLLYVPPPDFEGRKAILKLQVSKMATADLDLEKISSETELYSGADLKNLCREAAFIALRESQAEGDVSTDSIRIREKHFIAALKVIKASISPDSLRQYSQL